MWTTINIGSTKKIRIGIGTIEVVQLIDGTHQNAIRLDLGRAEMAAVIAALKESMPKK